MEILAPAGNLESALAAINNGTDAIYLGLASSFSARQGADNFDEAAFCAIIRQAHLCDVKVYVAMNTIVKSGTSEWDNFIKDILFVYHHGADAIILQDVFIGKLIHETYPEIPLHLSTQAGVCNEEGAKLAKNYGFSRVILARETPIAEIEKITKIIETEVFVQGALCTCFSGQCYFSSFIGGNSGNRGRCKQPCRKLYSYDRLDNTERNYALSLSDLCVGEDIEKFIRIGVSSFKIEGRMRRPEYVAAAVRYYRAILNKKSDTSKELSDLKRTYNRGNYTKGLAFGQDKRFLSHAVQGHIGEKVGVVKVVNGKYCVESRFQPQKGDAFKILRDGRELGGAIFMKTEGKQFIISSKMRLKNGDGVFVTTDTEVNTRMLSAEKKGKIALSLYFHVEKKPIAMWNGISIEGDTVLQMAQNRPLTKEEIKNCFEKTDGNPIAISFENIEINGGIFIPKSELNAFRRKVFSAIFDCISNNNRPELSIEEIRNLQVPKIAGYNEKVAVIADDFTGVTTDIAIYKPNDYSKELPQSFINGNFEKYLYYPAFATGKDLLTFAAYIQKYALDGIYAENYGGLQFAHENKIKLFAGTGFNLSNEYSISQLLKNDFVAYYALSKELNEQECSALVGEKSFVLSSGKIKIMDLCYCPFGKTCAKCDKKEVYHLTDENNRIFPVRRIVDSEGNCRFEVYNCADLLGTGVQKAGQLLDLTLMEEKEKAISFKDDEEKQKSIYANRTSGHYKRGVL